MVLLLLLLASLTSAEFLTPVHEHDNGKLPDLCRQDTVMSCDLVQIDIASLHNAALDFRGTTLNFLDQPGKNTFTFSSEDGDEATFTIKLYYTPEVRDSVDDIRTMADQVIATTNQGYINSEIPLRASLHCLEETEEPESYFTAISDNYALTLFTHYKRGHNDNGNNLRGSADAAVLIVKNAGVCGIAWVLADTSDYAKKMTSMTKLSCALGRYTFGHELGHNMGLDHDKYESGGRNEPYSQGYHVPGTKFRTIMAYR